jgi:hypothetical protein
MGFEFDPFASGLDQPARIYTGPPPGQRTDWYVSEQQPVAMSPEQRAAARRALGLDGGHRGPRPAPHRADGRAALVAYWERERVKLIKHARDYSSWSVVIAPSAARNTGRVGCREPLDWHPQSADNECVHGRLAGDRCPQPQLKASDAELWKTAPRRLWPFDLPCWCWGEANALAPAAVGPAYGGTDVMRGHRTHDRAVGRGVLPREAESDVRRGVA